MFDMAPLSVAIDTTLPPLPRDSPGNGRTFPHGDVRVDPDVA
jgi:hypothetical protein